VMDWWKCLYRLNSVARNSSSELRMLHMSARFLQEGFTKKSKCLWNKRLVKRFSTLALCKCVVKSYLEVPYCSRNVVPVHATRPYGGVETLHSFLIFVLDGDEWSASPLGCFTPRVAPVVTVGGWLSPRGGVDALENEKISFCQESNNHSSAVQPVSCSVYRLRCPCWFSFVFRSIQVTFLRNVTWSSASVSTCSECENVHNLTRLLHRILQVLFYSLRCRWRGSFLPVVRDTKNWNYVI
jgi:hypothetical protein